MADTAPSTRTRAGARERRRREEVLRRHRSALPARQDDPAGQLTVLHAQLRVAASLSARLAAAREVQEMAELVVEELHESFAFYLAAIQRCCEEDNTLRLVAASGPLAEVMAEFLLVEQSICEGVNGRVARTGLPALVCDTRADPDYLVRDPHTDPRSELSVPITVDGRIWGVLNIEGTEPDGFGEADVVLVESVAASLGSAIHRAGLVADVERALTTTLTALMSTIEAKDEYTASHEEEVARLAEQVARRLGFTVEGARDVRYAALLHDIGKVAVPSEILLKPAALTDDEWVVMRGHAAAGAALVARIDAFAHLAGAVRACHERWDGAGYPDGLAGERIPIAARIIAACDTFDAIVSNRPYRRARTTRQAASELRRVAGSQLDERVVEALLGELAV